MVRDVLGPMPAGRPHNGLMRVSACEWCGIMREIIGFRYEPRRLTTSASAQGCGVGIEINRSPFRMCIDDEATAAGANAAHACANSQTHRHHWCVVKGAAQEVLQRSVECSGFLGFRNRACGKVPMNRKTIQILNLKH